MEAGDPQAALEEVEDLETALEGYYPWHATRGELLVRLGRTGEGLASLRRAIASCDNDAVVDHLRGRIGALSG